MSEKNHCEICDELVGGTGGVALWPKLAGPAPENRIVVENDAYVGLVTVGPIARGHCLVVPRVHRLAMTSGDHRDRQRLTYILHQLVAQMQEIYAKPVLLFEHGAAEGSDVRPCTVSHAHWHLVPTTIKAEELLLAEYSWSKCASPWVHADREYLLVGDTLTRYWVTYPQSRIPSQSLRKALAERTGRSLLWDWRSAPEVELALATLGDFRAAGGRSHGGLIQTES